jgi:hypothetical protein
MLSPEGSSCNHLCTLDGLIHYSEERHRHRHIRRNLRYMGYNNRGSVTDNRREETIHQRFLQRREERRNTKGIESSSTSSSSPTSSSSSPSLSSACGSKHPKNSDFFYQRLIQVPCLSVHECCDHDNIGSKQIVTLSLVSIFNLAVVCHLKAMDQQCGATTTGSPNTSQAATSSGTTQELHKALGLYELAYKALENQCNSACSISEASENMRKSVQFRLVLCNNLSHAHNLAGHRSQHERYLREVLSTIMSLVDSQRPSNTNNNRHHHSSNSTRTSTSNEGCCIDLEGFLANAAPLMTEDFCADAA